VTVVAAGVHGAVVGAGVGQVRPLGDRQRVDVRPQCDARLARVADPRDRRRLGVGDAVDVLDSEPIQLLANHRRRLELLIPELGDLVQPVAQLRDLRVARAN